jgi:cell division septation protein DedD
VPDPILSTSESRMRRPDPAAGSPAVARARPGRWLWAALPILAAFGVFGIVVWLAYEDTSGGSLVGEPPLIRALAEPIKLPPEEAEESTTTEGGAVGRLWSDAERLDQPERLLPPPEQPRSPPVVATPDVDTEPPAEPGTPASSAAPGEVAGTTQPPQPADGESMAEAEAALDRLLAEVTALSEQPPPSPGAATRAPDEAAPVGAPPADRPPPAAAETAPSAPASEPPPPAEPVGPSEAEREATTAAATPDATPPASPEIRQARASSVEPPAPEPAPRQSAALAPRPAPTASPAPTPTETARVAAIPDRFRVQLAAVREEAAAHRAWDLFLADLGFVLSDVQPYFERAETANGTFYRVQIGPFATQQAAESRCEQLKQRNASCFVIRR